MNRRRFLGAVGAVCGAFAVGGNLTPATAVDAAAAATRGRVLRVGPGEVVRLIGDYARVIVDGGEVLADSECGTVTELLITGNGGKIGYPLQGPLIGSVERIRGMGPLLMLPGPDFEDTLDDVREIAPPCEPWGIYPKDIP